MKRIVSIALVILGCTVASAQSFQFVNLPGSPVDAALGGATFVLKSDAFSAENNPAEMSLSENKFSAAATYQMWTPTSNKTTVAGLGAFYRIKHFSVGLSGRYFMEQPYDIIDKNAKVTGSFKPTHNTVALALGYSIETRKSVYSLGIVVRNLSFGLAEDVKVSSLTFDLMGEYCRNGFKAGIGIKNLGPNIKVGTINAVNYDVPTFARAGASYNIKGFSVTGEFDYMLKGGIMAGAGVQYELFDVLALRAGYHYGTETTIPQYFSAGLGINVIGIELDAAAMFSSLMGTSLSFGLGYNF